MLKDKNFLEFEKIFLHNNNLKKISPDLADIDKDFDYKNLIIETPYSSSQNFCQEKLYGNYGNNNFIYLHNDTYKALSNALSLAKKQNLKIKIWDGYRPFEVQAFMAEKHPDFVERGFVSHPLEGVATHVRGIAVDLTLVDSQNQELEMGSEFDEMSDKSHHDSKNISNLAVKNRNILIEIMLKAGFQKYQEEWWHYHLPILDIQSDGSYRVNKISAEKYPKILDKFPELLSDEVKQFFNLK
jgi:D-alanyl-D-alanine dipeptidase